MGEKLTSETLTLDFDNMHTVLVRAVRHHFAREHRPQAGREVLDELARCVEQRKPHLGRREHCRENLHFGVLQRLDEDQLAWPPLQAVE